MTLRLALAFILVVAIFAPAPSRAQEPPPPSEPAKPDSAPVSRIRIGGNVAASKIITRVQPQYPPLARQTRISGTVRLHAIIAKDGSIRSLDVVSGHPLLQQASLDAVRQWRYEPTTLNGEAVEVDTTIDVIFALDQPPPPASQTKTLHILAGNISEFQRDMLELMAVTHFRENAIKSGRRVFDSLRPALLSSLPSTPSREKILDAYIDHLVGMLDTDAYVDRVIAIYQKYFTDEDIKGLTEFYRTPTGQHFNSVMPLVLGDLNQLGQAMATDNLPTIFKQLCTEFPELKTDARFCNEPDPQRKSKLSSAEPFPSGM